MGLHRRIISPADAVALFAGLADEARERLWAAWLDGENDVIRIDAGPPVDVASAPLPMAELLREAISCGAATLILAHGHPGGDPAPSSQDIRATRRLADAADAIGVRLLDHIIVATGGWTSFRLLGLL